MADVGAVLQRMLDPRWETVVGTIREWTDLGYLATGGSMRPPGSNGGMSFSVVLSASGPGHVTGSSGPPTEHESWKRLWVRRDGRSRVEHRTPGVEAPFLTEIHDPEGISTIGPDGSVRRGEAPLFQTLPTWLLDPGSLLGLLRLSFGADDEFAGRPVLHATATMRAELPHMAMSAGPMLYGMPIGGRSELTIDVETGILARFATFEGARLIGMRQFIDLVVDQPVEDALVTYRLLPGQRFRTHRDDMLDMLRAEGEDVSDIDPEDGEAVQAAMQRFHERQRELRGGPAGPPQARPLAELVVPLGPPPGEAPAARAAIAEAVAGLSPADPEPRRRWIERGELLDKPFARSRERSESMTQGRPVTMELADVVFLREDEALFDFVIRMGPAEFRREGRAVLRDGRWLVSYDTAAALLGLGGVTAPSLLDRPDEEP